MMRTRIVKSDLSDREYLIEQYEPGQGWRNIGAVWATGKNSTLRWHASRDGIHADQPSQRNRKAAIALLTKETP